MSSFAKWYALALAGAALALLYLLAPVLMPFAASAGLAYLGDPLVDRLQRYRLSRTLAVSGVFVVLFGLGLLTLVLLLPRLQEQAVILVRNIPEWLQLLQEKVLPRLGITLPALDAASLREVLAQHWSQAGGFAAAVLGPVSQSGLALLAFAANMLLVPVVTFYLLRDWDHLVAWIRDMIPRRLLPRVTELARETDEVLGAFIRGQLLVMASLSVFYMLGLWLAGLDLAILIGLAAGLVSFVPYLGFIVGVAAAGIAMLVQTQEFLPLVWVLLVFGIGQILESAIFTPWLVGDRIGLHPVAVIFAVMTGGLVFGFTGVLLALPAAAALAVFLRHAKQEWLQSQTYLQP